jgi:hypothetical protein
MLEPDLDDAAFEQVVAPWAVKEHLRWILNAQGGDKAQSARTVFKPTVTTAELPVRERLSGRRRRAHQRNEQPGYPLGILPVSD